MARWRWRGAEKHFLSLWQGEGRPRKLERIGIVVGSKQDAVEVQDHLREAGIVCEDMLIDPSGFSHFLRSNGLASFLQSTP
jgi:hypothetical protein